MSTDKFHKSINWGPYTNWRESIDPKGAVCEIRGIHDDPKGVYLALGEVAIMDGLPVVLVDDDAHTILTVDDLRDTYRIVVLIPAPLDAYYSDPVEDCKLHGQYCAGIVERASRLALDHVAVTYTLS